MNDATRAAVYNLGTLYTWPMALFVAVMTLVIALTGHPQEPVEYFRAVTLAMAGVVLLYIPLTGWQDRNLSPYRWMLFLSLWIFVAGCTLNLIFNFGQAAVEWQNAPLLFVGCSVKLAYIYVRYGRPPR